VKREKIEREKPIHTKNWGRLKRGKIQLERESEERKGKERSFGKILIGRLSKYILQPIKVLETLLYQF
jgi:hypothetical protein